MVLTGKNKMQKEVFVNFVDDSSFVRLSTAVEVWSFRRDQESSYAPTTKIIFQCGFWECEEKEEADEFILYI